MPFEGVTIAEVGIEPDAGVVDEDVEGLDSLDCGTDLRRVGHVQVQRRHAPIGVGQRLTRSGVHTVRASPQSFLDQRLSNTAIGSGHQNCFAFHVVLLG